MLYEADICDDDWEVIKSTITGLLNDLKLDEGGGTDEADIRRVERSLQRAHPWTRRRAVFRIAMWMPELLDITDEEESEVVSDNLTIEYHYREININEHYSLCNDSTTHVFKSHCTNTYCKNMGQEILEPVADGDILHIEDKIGLEMACYDCDETWLVNWETGQRLPRCRCCEEEIDDPYVLEEINRGLYISHCSECRGYHCDFCAREISERTCTDCIEEGYQRDEYMSENFSESAEKAELGYRRGGRDIYDTRGI
tara:strand:+ start:187 stop:954 length:768 start_codon:yes stop_codon:yes gene_type:complete